MTGVADPSPAAAVVVVGAGNIGSQVPGPLAGISLQEAHVIDPDRYEARNVGQQRIRPADVGRPKAIVQAEHLRRLTRGLRVRAWVRPVEAVPLGYFRHKVILSCVDSRVARQAINRIAARVQSPWIDAAISAGGLVRVQIFRPGGPCLECRWGPDDYAALEQRHVCQFGSPRTTPTDAPAEVGALAAALQVWLLRALLGEAGSQAPTEQWCLDLAHQKAFTAHFEVNPHCLLDHRSWTVTPLAATAASLTLGEALALAGPAPGATLAVDGQVFVRRMRCGRCGRLGRSGLRLSRRTGARACPGCGAVLRATGLDVSDTLVRAELPATWLDRPLAALGFEERDIFTVTDGGGEVRHFEIGAPDPGSREEGSR